jgi:hypothetical protein
MLNSVSASHKKCYVSIQRTNWLFLFSNIIAVYSENFKIA